MRVSSSPISSRGVLNVVVGLSQVQVEETTSSSVIAGCRRSQVAFAQQYLAEPFHDLGVGSQQTEVLGAANPRRSRAVRVRHRSQPGSISAREAAREGTPAPTGRHEINRAASEPARSSMICVITSSFVGSGGRSEATKPIGVVRGRLSVMRTAGGFRINQPVPRQRRAHGNSAAVSWVSQNSYILLIDIVVPVRSQPRSRAPNEYLHALTRRR